jgi:hypothetical protein
MTSSMRITKGMPTCVVVWSYPALSIRAPAHGESRRLVNYAPFASSAERPILSHKSEFTPGPGAYGRVVRSRAKPNSIASTSFVNRVARFSEPSALVRNTDVVYFLRAARSACNSWPLLHAMQETQTPGPGYYHDTDPWHVQQLHSAVQIRRNKDHHPSGSQSIEWVKVHAPPSIPSQRQSFGFKEDPETGALVAQKPAFTGLGGSGGSDSVGPADYVVHDTFLSKHKASTATSFSASRTHRDLFVHIRARKGEKLVPGPGR